MKLKSVKRGGDLPRGKTLQSVTRL